MTRIDDDSSRDWDERLTNQIGKAVQAARKRYGMTAQELAEQCGYLGLTMKRSVIANLESGRRSSISVAEVIVMAEILGVPPITLIYPPKDAGSMGERVSGEREVIWQSRNRFAGDSPPAWMIAAHGGTSREDRESKVALPMRQTTAIKNLEEAIGSAWARLLVVGSDIEKLAENGVDLSVLATLQTDDARLAFIGDDPSDTYNDRLRFYFAFKMDSGSLDSEVSKSEQLLSELQRLEVSTDAFETQLDELKTRIQQTRWLVELRLEQ